MFSSTDPDDAWEDNYSEPEPESGRLIRYANTPDAPKYHLFDLFSIKPSLIAIRPDKFRKFPDDYSCRDYPYEYHTREIAETAIYREVSRKEKPDGRFIIRLAPVSRAEIEEAITEFYKDADIYFE